MKIIGISGSPVENGNNEQAIDFALARAKDKGFEVETIALSKAKIGYCTACDYCKNEKGECSIDDDMNQIMPKLAEADAIIISAPVYFGSVCAQVKAVFDRSRPLRRAGFRLKDKIGAAIAIGASRNGGQEYALQAIQAWMHLHGMIVVGDNNHFGGTVMAPFEKDEFGRETVEATIDKVCEVLQKINSKS